MSEDYFDRVMTNKEIGKIFFQIAKILELSHQEDRFRIVAYEKAAQTIENFPKELTELYNDGGIKALLKIPNIGKSTAEKIEELIHTGKIKYFEEIKKDVPISEVVFIEIPGVGPKTAIKIAKELKAKDIDDLERKIKNGEADELFKEKTRNNILRGIDIKRRLTGRMLITEALPIAEKIVAYLKKETKIEKINYVGSLRRKKETIGDIDIVCATSEPQKVIGKFVSMKEVISVMASGPNKAMIIFAPNAHVDLEIVPEEEYGSLLQHLTGSKEHNVAIRSYALTVGKSVSEHGIKIIKNGKESGKINCASEECVYENLNMDWIPPELREGGGEVEAALNHRLPRLVKIEDIIGDLHVHSNWSDGNMSIEEIVRAAEGLNYQYIVISDHTVGLGIARGLDEKRLEERQKEIEEVQAKHPKVRILSSVEVNIKVDGNLDIKDWMLEKLDIVTASIHSSLLQEREMVTNRLIKAINNPLVDIIGHPSGRIIGQREGSDIDWPKIFRSCEVTGTALEISAFPNRLDLRDNLCKLAKSYGVKFAINTDAHQKQHLDLMRFGISVARRGWLEKEDIINTKKVDDLLSWAKRTKN